MKHQPSMRTWSLMMWIVRSAWRRVAAGEHATLSAGFAVEFKRRLATDASSRCRNRSGRLSRKWSGVRPDEIGRPAGRRAVAAGEGDDAHPGGTGAARGGAPDHTR